MTFDARTLWPMVVSAQQIAAAAVDLPEFIEVPTTRISFDRGDFLTVVVGAIIEWSSVLRGVPDLSTTRPNTRTVVGASRFG